MIAIDDLNDWTGFLDGHPDVLTPHMDALAAQGRNFTNAHCAVPVCSASRVSVMSGVAATTHGSYELGANYEDLPALKGVPTIQQYFKDQGYLTLAGGKVLHHGFTGRLADGIDRTLLERGRTSRPAQPLNLPTGWSKAWDSGAWPQTEAEMYDRQLADQAAAALTEDFDQPFFMSVGFFRPHVPLHVPSKWFDLYDRESLTLPDNPLADLEDIPENFLSINDYAVAPTHADVIETNMERALTHAYLASISFVDDCVGIVLDALKNSPHADNTIIVLWSDHGFHLGEKQHWAKRTLWEESTRVPLIIAGPTVTPDQSSPEAVSLLDIYPTLIELTGIPDNPHMEGISLAPQLDNPTTARKHPAITSSYFGNHSIRTKDWRYIAYRDGAAELYDHRTDPDEFHNLANDPAHQAVRNQLAQWVPPKGVPEFKTKSERPPN